MIAFLIGVWFFLIKKSPLYFRLLFYGVACFFFEELYYLTDYVCTGTWSDAYSFAAFGASAGYAFMLSANYGQFDSFVDDRSEGCRKTGRLALFMPAVLTTVYIFSFISFIKNTGNVLYVVLTVFCKTPMVFAAYYHTKHLFLPDKLHFWVDSLRFCNAVCLVVILADFMSDVFYAFGNMAAYSICETVFSLSLILMMISAKRGHRKWTVLS